MNALDRLRKLFRTIDNHTLEFVGHGIWGDNRLRLQVATYPNNRVAIVALTSLGEPACKVTVNLVQYDIEETQFFVKNDSEGRQVAQVLYAQGLIRPVEPFTSFASGRVQDYASLWEICAEPARAAARDVYEDEIDYILDILVVVLGPERFDRFAVFIDSGSDLFSGKLEEKNMEINPHQYADEPHKGESK